MEKFIWRNLISINIRVLRIGGLWPENEQFKNFSSYTCITFFVLVSITTHAVCQMINIVFVYSNMDILTESFFVCIYKTQSLLKIYIFIRKMPLLKRLMLALENDLFQPRNPGQILLIWPDVKIWKNVYYILSGAATVGVLMWLLFPILSGSYKTYALPFYSWYPYGITKPFVYKLTYLHQTVSSFLLILGCFNIDMLISALMMYTGAQCDILCDNLRRSGFESEGFETSFKRCILHHKKILRFAENCDDLFNIMVFGQFLYSSVCIATTLYRVASLTPSSFEFYSHIFAITAIITQMFTYCWFGDKVETQSQAICYAAFESRWMQENVATKRNLIIFTQRAQSPIGFAAFKLLYLSLETFVKILRTAVSYYTVLLELSNSKL